MRKLKVVLVAVVSALSLFIGAGTASAGPLDEVCENFPGPHDGKARLYQLLCG